MIDLGFLISLNCTIFQLQAGTKVSPKNMVRSVRVLGIQVKLFNHNEVKMLPIFLRCFPNVETLYIQVNSFTMNDPICVTAICQICVL